MNNRLTMKKYALLYIFCILILFTTQIVAQTSADTSLTVTRSANNNDVVDLSEQATVIKVEPEKPRVTLITERIKPEFTDINLDKSFLKELLTKNEKSLLEQKLVTKERLIIDVEKIVNKTR